MMSTAGGADKANMVPTQCAICGDSENYTIVYPARLPKIISAKAYAAWRDRDYLHYQFVRCNTCSLVRSNPILSEEAIKTLYADTTFDHTEVQDISASIDTYRRYFLRMLEKYNVARGALLEIGCGDGFFFSIPRAAGFQTIQGVEPTMDAVSRASLENRALIIRDIFRADQWKPESFDVVCFFQTLDHILDPNTFLQDCFKVLKPGGFVLAINHNEASFSARAFGEGCPIFDIGHAYLYNLATMRRIFEKNGFAVLEAFSVRSTAYVKYLIHLMPLPLWIKNPAKKIAAVMGLGNIPFRIYMGNLGCIAQKPLEITNE